MAIAARAQKTVAGKIIDAAANNTVSGALAQVKGINSKAVTFAAGNGILYFADNYPVTGRINNINPGNTHNNFKIK
jgi:hypothetical protein